MTRVTTRPKDFRTVAALLERLGDIPPGRVRLRPAPGTATEQDVVQVERREDRLCELVDGVLVEKAVGAYESYLAMALGHFFLLYLQKHKRGFVVGEAALIGLAPGLVRIPDVSFVSWSRVPDRRIPRQPLSDLVPDLAVEILSKGNTPKEMRRKLGDYFRAGVRLVWLIDPVTRTAEAYTAATRKTRIGEDGALKGAKVLPGFVLALPELFAYAAQLGGD